MTLAAIERRARHAWTQRIKLLVQMLTTTSYGALGFALGEPILRGSSFTLSHGLALVVGSVSVYVAFTVAPDGERDVPA